MHNRELVKLYGIQVAMLMLLACIVWILVGEEASPLSWIKTGSILCLLAFSMVFNGLDRRLTISLRNSIRVFKSEPIATPNQGVQESLQFRARIILVVIIALLAILDKTPFNRVLSVQGISLGLVLSLMVMNLISLQIIGLLERALKKWGGN